MDNTTDSTAAGATPATGSARADRPTVSIVVPCFNEASNLPVLIEGIDRACSSAGIAWDAILVNDGSADDTWPTILRLAGARANVIGLDLSRNFGKEVAMMAGLDRARGEAVIFMDADLQHPPEAIPDLIAAWRKGAEVVDAVRDARTGQSAPGKWLARLFYRVFSFLAGFELPDDVGDFRLLDRRVADILRSMREQKRFTKGLMAWVGFHHTRVPYRQGPRAGAAHAGMALSSRLTLASHGITSFSSYPLRIWSIIGFFFSGIGFTYIAFRAIRALIHGIDVPGFESIIAIMLFFGGLQLITLGILGHYIGRIYDETKGRPLYIVREDTASGSRHQGD